MFELPEASKRRRPWGGDKPGLKYLPTGSDEDARAAAAQVEAVHRAQRDTKRAVKRDIEKRRNDKLKLIDALRQLDEIQAIRRRLPSNASSLSAKEVSEVDDALKGHASELVRWNGEDTKRIAYALARTSYPTAKQQEEGEDPGAEAEKKVVLFDYHDEAGKAGWDWDKLQADLKAKGLQVRDDSGFTEVYDEEHDPNAPTHSFSFQRADRKIITSSAGTPVAEVRFDDDRVVEDPTVPGVRVQIGYLDESDENFRRRKQYVWDDLGIPTHRYMTRAINHFHLANMVGFDLTYDKDPEKRSVAFSYQQDDHGDFQPIRGHQPRAKKYRESATFGAVKDVLDYRSAAAVDPTLWDEGLRAAGADHAYERGGDEVRLPISGLSGTPMKNNAGDNSLLTEHEKSPVQQRAGSAARTQTKLSGTGVQAPLPKEDEKLIVGNKGESFVDSPEGMAVIEVDLAAARAQDIGFKCQYAEGSHKFKIAWARWKEASTTEHKREAEGELDLLIWSARKNREIVIDHIPNSIITKINFARAKERYDDFPFAAGWIPFDDGVVQKLLEYFDRDRWYEVMKGTEQMGHGRT